MLEINISARKVKGFRSNLHKLKQIVHQTLINSLICLCQTDIKLNHVIKSYIFIEVLLVDDNLMEKYNKKFRDITCMKCSGKISYFMQSFMIFS